MVNGKMCQENQKKMIKSLIDFIGSINNEEFEGNSAKDFKLVLEVIQ